MAAVKRKKNDSSTKKDALPPSEPSTSTRTTRQRQRRATVNPDDSGIEDVQEISKSKKTLKRREVSPKVESFTKKTRLSAIELNVEDTDNHGEVVIELNNRETVPQRKMTAAKRGPSTRSSSKASKLSENKNSSAKTELKTGNGKRDQLNANIIKEEQALLNKPALRRRQAKSGQKVTLKDSSEDEDFTDDVDADFLPETKAKNSREKRGKRQETSDSDSDTEIPRKRVRQPNPTAKKRNNVTKKSFMKPSKSTFKFSDKANDEQAKGDNNDNSQSIFSSAREERLLLIARKMDKGKSDEDSSQSANGSISGKERSAKTKDNNVDEEDARRRNEILVMLKEHEQVEEMSSDSEDSEDCCNEVEGESKPMKKQLSDKISPKGQQEKGGEGVAGNIDVVGEKTKRNPPRSKSKRGGGKGPENASSKINRTAKRKLENNVNGVNSNKGENFSESEDGNDDDDDWEVVENAAVRDPNYQRPDKVTVVLKHEDFLSDSKRLSMEQQIMRFLNRRRKELQLLRYNAHLLTLLAYQRYLNSVIETNILKAITLSSLPDQFVLKPTKSAPKNRSNSRFVQSILLYCKQSFEFNPQEAPFSVRLLEQKLRILMKKRMTSCNIIYLLGIVLIMRTLGVPTRLCLSHRPLTHKPSLLRQKDGEMVEVGSKSSIVETTGVLDYFAEVYLTDRKCWRPLDLEEHSIINDPHELGEHLDQPAVYIASINESGVMKDLTPKYQPNWLSKGMKLRAGKFFENTISLFAPNDQDEDHVEEQKEVANLHAKQGLPKTIAEYKNHPKYALTRHLLKFEAFYPPNPEILGYINKEPVHPRECVKILHSKDQWHRFAREVREGEEPYKLVKARPKWDRKNDCLIRDLPPLEVFGEWQTDPYKPPVIVDGKIPRNRFGNVELFHPDMLPIGGVHLKLPGLNRIAQELGVDCVPAVVGFDGVQRGLHAVYEGFIVCAEHKDALEAAWHEIQNEGRQKRRERVRKRAIKNWKELIRKVMWNNHLNKKYKHNLK